VVAVVNLEDKNPFKEFLECLFGGHPFPAIFLLIFYFLFIYKMKFDDYPLAILKQHASQHKDIIKGYSKMKKGELVATLTKHLKINKKGDVSRRKKAIQGDGFFKGKEGTNVCSPDCNNPPECEKERKFAQMARVDRHMGSTAQNLLSVCNKKARKKRGCPDPCVVGKTDSGLDRIGQKMLKPMEKFNNVVLGAATVASEPVFLAACGTAGASIGGPVGSLAAVGACKTIYNKMMKQPGYKEGFINKAGFTPEEVKVLEKISNAGIKASGGSIVDRIEQNLKLIRTAKQRLVKGGQLPDRVTDKLRDIDLQK